MEVSKSQQNENLKAEAVKVPDGMNNSHDSFKKITADSGKSGKSASSLPIPASFPRQIGNTGRDLYYKEYVLIFIPSFIYSSAINKSMMMH